MKKLIGLLGGLLMASTVTWAGNNVDVISMDSTKAAASVSVYPGSPTGTVVTTAVPTEGGFVQSVEVICGYAAQTCSVWIVTETNAGPHQAQQTIYTNSALSASTVVYPRVQMHTTGGATLASTNAPYEPIFLVGGQVKMYCWNSTLDSNTTVQARIKLHR